MWAPRRRRVPGSARTFTNPVVSSSASRARCPGSTGSRPRKGARHRVAAARWRRPRPPEDRRRPRRAPRKAVTADSWSAGCSWLWRTRRASAFAMCFSWKWLARSPSAKMLATFVVAAAVGDEGVIAEGGEKARLGTRELGPPDDQAMALVVHLSDPGLAVLGVLDRRPRRLLDAVQAVSSMPSMTARTEGFCGAVIE